MHRYEDEIGIQCFTWHAYLAMMSMSTYPTANSTMMTILNTAYVACLDTSMMMVVMKPIVTKVRIHTILVSTNSKLSSKATATYSNKQWRRWIVLSL